MKYMYMYLQVLNMDCDDCFPPQDMNIEKVVNFPYPTPPDIEQIKVG